MRILAKRPMLLMWATAVAIFLAQAHHARGGRGFHEW
jgi:hypothetical protein